MGKLVCRICGMEVNEKNYDFNKEAFLESNSLESIKFCPFCGVTSEFITEENGQFTIDRSTLNENALKIIDHAVKLEIFNGDYYNKASLLAKDEKLKKMFKSLSRIEYTHAKIHLYLGGFKEIPELADMDYGKYDSDTILKEIAQMREMHAVSYYKRYSKQIDCETIKLIFAALSDVETEHIQLTEK